MLKKDLGMVMVSVTHFGLPLKSYAKEAIFEAASIVGLHLHTGHIYP